MNTLRVWLIHRLGGVEKPVKDAFVEACLKNAYGGWGPSTIGSFTSTSDVGPETHLHCRCSRCRASDAGPQATWDSALDDRYARRKWPEPGSTRIVERLR